MINNELKTALVKTLRKREQEDQPNPAFRGHLTLVAESEEMGVVVLRQDTNNYDHQRRTGNYSDSNAWEDLVVATREGYRFLGSVNLYNTGGYKPPFHISKGADDALIISCSRGVFSLKDQDIKNGYDFPFELPPSSEMVKTSYNLDGTIVVIDDDHTQGDHIEEQMSGLLANGTRGACSPVGRLHRSIITVGDAIKYLPSHNLFEDDWKPVKLVLVDGNFRGDGSGFNTAGLIPILRQQYPNAILFANSGKGENHTCYNADLLMAGCDLALHETAYGYKSFLGMILARIAESKPEIRVTETFTLHEILKI